jgi:hypothetical protein
MGNLFDGIRDSAFDVTLATFGYDASWIPVATPEADPFTARVHYKDPNEKESLGGVEYTPLSPFMEYRSPSFPGLYESARNNNGEIVTVNGAQYTVRSVERKFDGKTYMAILEPIEE